MATLISSVVEQILEEGGIINAHAEREALLILERSKHLKRIENNLKRIKNNQYRDWLDKNAA